MLSMIFYKLNDFYPFLKWHVSEIQLISKPTPQVLKTSTVIPEQGQRMRKWIAVWHGRWVSSLEQLYE